MPNALEVDALAHGTTVTLAGGQRLIVRLRENPSTGYRWSLEASGNLRVETDQFLPGGASPGQGSVRQLSLVATAAGTSQLELALRRTWEAANPIERFRLSVISR